MNAIDRNLLFGQVADNCIRHVLRILNTSLSASVRVAGDLNDVTLLTLQLSRDLTQRILRLFIQHGLAGAKAYLSVVHFLILVKVRNGRTQLGSTSTCLQRRLVRLGGGA